MTAKAQETVLVVDDSAEILELLGMALESSGYRVLSAADATTAFEIVRRERPAVLVTDIMLGVTNGLDLITRLRSDLAPPLPAVVAMSGFGGVGEEALRRGATSFLPKPFIVEDLLHAVRGAAAGRAPSARAVRRVANGSRHNREKAAAAATVALERIGPRYAEMHRRCVWTVHWVPAYLGFGHAFMALLRKGRLCAIAASEGAPVELDVPIGERVPLVRDIAETASSIVLSGQEAPGFGGVRGFFAGVPLRIGPLAVGAFCVLDEKPHALAADDLEVLQAFGRRASSVLAGRLAGAPAALWESSGLLSGAAYDVMLSALLGRCQAGSDALHVIAVSCRHSPSLWRETLATVLGREHTCIADVGGGRYAIVAARAGDGDYEEEIAEMLAAWAEVADAHVGLVSVDNAAVAAVGEQEVTRLAEVALERTLARREQGGERIERFAIGRAAPSREEQPLSPD